MNFEKFRKQHFEVEKRIWDILLLVYKYNKKRYHENKREKPDLLYDKHKRFRLKNAEKIKAY